VGKRCMYYYVYQVHIHTWYHMRAKAYWWSTCCCLRTNINRCRMRNTESEIQNPNMPESEYALVRWIPLGQTMEQLHGFAHTTCADVCETI
jgi:hypothetical protein